MKEKNCPDCGGVLDRVAQTDWLVCWDCHHSVKMMKKVTVHFALGTRLFKKHNGNKVYEDVVDVDENESCWLLKFEDKSEKRLSKASVSQLETELMEE